MSYIMLYLIISYHMRPPANRHLEGVSCYCRWQHPLCPQALLLQNSRLRKSTRPHARCTHWSSMYLDAFCALALFQVAVAVVVLYAIACALWWRWGRQW